MDIDRLAWREGSTSSGQAESPQTIARRQQQHHVEAALGRVMDYVDLWVFWATIDVKTKGARPNGAAPFDPGARDNSNKLGAVTYKSLASSVIDEKAGIFGDNMGHPGRQCRTSKTRLMRDKFALATGNH
jgi:hypothetical protein